MERDEVYVPKTRTDLGIPPEGTRTIDYDEIFGDTPIYTMYLLIRQQIFAFPAYLREYHVCILHLVDRAYLSPQCVGPKKLPKMDQSLWSSVIS